MRIVDVCAFYTPHGGGVKTYVERKLRAGAAAGHEIIILAPGDRNEAIEIGDRGRLVTLAAPRFPLDRRYSYFDSEASLHDRLDQLQPDFVEASSPWTSASMVSRWPGPAPRALVMHADPLSAYAYRWFGTLASRETIDRRFAWFWRHLQRLDAGFDLVVSASESLSRRLREGGLRKVLTNPMGVEPGIFSPAHRDEVMRRRLLERCNLPPDATLLIGVGRLASEKRWPMVVDAVTAAGCSGPVGLVLIGDGRDRTRVLRSASNNPHVQLLAPISDRALLARLIASADALVHGCEAETFCMVAAEAKASGLPLILPDEGGASDQYQPGQGLRYRAADPTSLSAAIRMFVANDPSSQRNLAAIAASQTRSMDRHFEELFEAYEDRIRSVRYAL